jgi:SAM-dependent methyltransferase
MPLPPEPQREYPSTYFVQDRSNQEELNRLRVFDYTLTAGMGGVLPEQPDPTAFPRVPDVGCGTGGWLIELAKTTPTCTRLVGADVSFTFVEYARAQAEAAQVSDRVEFRLMDALLMLEFPTGTFDLVNHRAAQAGCAPGTGRNSCTSTSACAAQGEWCASPNPLGLWRVTV